MRRPLAIAGVGQTPYARHHAGASTGDLVYRVVAEALADAGLDRADVDAVVAGVAPDALGGVNCAEKSALGAATPPGAPFFRVNTGGGTRGGGARGGQYRGGGGGGARRGAGLGGRGHEGRTGTS